MKKFSIEEITENLRGSLKRDHSPCVFVDSNLPHSELFQRLIPESKDTLIIERHLSGPNHLQPYEPFLGILKELYDKSNISYQELKKVADINYLHSELLRDYFTGRPRRREEIQQDQLFYDRSELYRAIIAILRLFLEDQKSIVIVSGFQYISKDCFTLFQKITEVLKDVQVSWVLCSELRSWDHNHEYGEEETPIKNFIFEKDFPLFQIFQDESPSEGKSASLIPPKEASIALEIIRAKVNFLDLHGAERDLLYLIEYQPFHLQEQEEKKLKFTLGELLGDTYRFSGDSLQAMNQYNPLLEEALLTKNKRDLSRIYRKLGECYFLKQNVEMAEKLTAQGLKIAKEIGDSELTILAQASSLSISHGYARLEQYNDLKSTFEDLMLQAQAKGFQYIAARSCGNFVADGNFIAYGLVSAEERIAICDKGIKIARRIRNKHLLGALYHNKATIHAIGNGRDAFRFYRKSKKLKVEVGDLKEIVRIDNGMGYAYFLLGEWNKALSHFSTAIGLLTEVEDYLEICLTIFNIAETFFFASGYRQAIDYFGKLIKLVKILELEKIPFHSFGEIYAMLGICYYHLGNSIKAMDMYQNISRHAPDPPKKEQALTELLRILLSDQNVRIDGMDDLLQYCSGITGEGEGKLIRKRILLESAWLNHGLGQVQKAQSQYEMIRSEESTSGEWHYTHLVTALMNNLESQPKGTPPPVKLREIEINFHTIFQLINTKMALNRLHRKISDINFLNNVQQRLLEQQRPIEALLDDILVLIYDFFIAEIVVFYHYEEGSWTRIDESPLAEQIIENIESKLLGSWEEKLVSRVQDDPEMVELFPDLNSMISLPIKGNQGILGHLFLATQNKSLSLNTDEFGILSIGAKQIGIALANRILQKKMRKHSTEIEKKNQELENVIDQLGITQKQLVESEKMASLGSLVAGVAHEINTPLGISITSSTYVKELSQEILEKLNNGSLTKAEMESHLGEIIEASNILGSNLERSVSLVKSFKQVAVDQSSDEMRVINLKDYLEEIITSLRPAFKHSKVQIKVEGESEMEICSHPGTLYKIINNLVLNSLVHAFDPGESGKIHVHVFNEAGLASITISDNGRGVPHEIQGKIFDPFFTTGRNKGGVGLGLSIVYNLVTQKLGGNIRVESVPGQGTLFVLEFPAQPASHCR